MAAGRGCFPGGTQRGGNGLFVAFRRIVKLEQKHISHRVVVVVVVVVRNMKESISYHPPAQEENMAPVLISGDWLFDFNTWRSHTDGSKRAHAERKRAHAESKRAHAESKRAHAERKRAHAESKRAHAERKRAHAERKRAHAERKRAHAESKRAHAERKRAHAESKRAHAESKRAHAENLQLCFNFDTKNFKVFSGSKENQFGYTVQQHEAAGRQWCPLDRNSANCSRLNLGRLSLDNVSERKDNMRLGMTLTSNPRDSSFVTCGPLWSHECGSSLYSTGICSRVSRTFKLSHTIAPALQRCETFMDIVIVLDGSNSIYPWYEVQDFLITILQKFYIGPGQTQVGVVQYGSKVVHEFGLGEYQTVEEVVQAARGIDQRGGEETRTALGINVGRSEGFKRGSRPGAKKVMIVITDGESHDSPQLVQAVADSERDNVTMYAIAVLGYYNRRGINPEAFLKEIKFIASDPDEQHFFNVTDESSLKDIVDALGERIFSLEGSQGRRFGLQMAQAGFSSHLVKDGVLLGAVGAYDWNGAVLKETKHGKVVPPKSSYKDEFPEELKNHGAYLGYSVGSLISSRGAQLYVAGAPRFNHTGKVIVFTLKNTGNLTILQALLGEQIGSYFGSVLISMDVDDDGQTDVLVVAAPMFYSQGWETGRVYIYTTSFVLQGALQVSDRSQNARLGSALAQIPDMNGDGFRELVVGAPLEDDHQGALYVFYGHQKTLQHRFRQRVSASGLSSGLQYFGQSLHGVLDANGDGLVDLAVGALGAAVIVWSRGVVRIQATLTFEPEKVNMFNKDCRRGGKEVTCMSVSVSVWFSLVLDERRFPPRAVLDESERQQPRILVLQVGGRSCQRIGFSIQTADYGRPLAVLLETGLQSPDDGPVLDPDWPNVLRAELPFWNGCEQEDVCVPDLILHSHTDLMSAQQFCGSSEGASWSLCSQQGAPQGSLHVVEAGRRRVVVFARLENQGENAYGASVQISTSSNLLFSSLIDQSDIQIECHSEDRLANQRSCTISAPFMKSLSQVSFHLEFEFSRSVFLDHIRVLMATSSTKPTSSSPADTFNLTYNIQNSGVFPLPDVLFRAEIWAVTRGGNQLLNITDCSVLQGTVSQGTVSQGTVSQGTVSQGTVLRELCLRELCLTELCLRELFSGNCVSGNCVSRNCSQGTVSQGTVSQGTVSHGTVSRGTVSRGTVSRGTVSQGTVSHGTVSHGTVLRELCLRELCLRELCLTELFSGNCVSGNCVSGNCSQGTVSKGTVSRGTVSRGTVSRGTVSRGTVSRGTVSQGTVLRELCLRELCLRELCLRELCLMELCLRELFSGNCDTGNCVSGNCVSGNCVSRNCVSGNCVSGNCVSGNCVSRNCAQGTVSQGTVSHGTVSHGTVSQGTVSQGTVSQGTVSHGTVSLGTVSQGTVSQGTVLRELCLGELCLGELCLEELCLGELCLGELCLRELCLRELFSGNCSQGTVSQGTVSQGTVSQGTVSHGTVSQGTGTVSQGTVSQGTVSHGTVSQGTVSQGTVSHGTVSQGTVSQGTVSQGTVSHGTVSLGTVSQGTVSQGTVSHGTVSQGTVSRGTVSQGTVSQGTAPGSHCSLPPIRSTNQVAAEDLTHLSQLNQSTGVSEVFHCRLNLPASSDVRLSLKGRLQLLALNAVSFRSLEVLTSASVQLEASSPMFLQEERPLRQIIVELRKDEDHIVSVWIVVGSSVGGLLLLGLLVLGLWKLGFFNRRRRGRERSSRRPMGRQQRSCDVTVLQLIHSQI
ncbi:Integrin alpha-11 [Dissostichus eleginoides]|uniref:Integrin alpha-11 n=1 Tax=Dissostichus eleginoides TaxID=100907 RepID=A0AAD9BSP6_DISEL|nr:Integrin alpha-11 [Dissostichus eleginoides]